MASLNKVLLIGNLTRDPELSYTQQNLAICKVGMAINRRYQTQSGENREETTFVDITVFGRSGEAFERFFRKGRPVFIEGRLHYHSWEAQDGSKRSKLEVVCENWSFVDSARENAASGAGPGQGASRSPGGYGEQRGGEQRREERREARTPRGGGPEGDFPNEDDFNPPDENVPF